MSKIKIKDLLNILMVETVTIVNENVEYIYGLHRIIYKDIPIYYNEYEVLQIMNEPDQLCIMVKQEEV